MLQMRVSEFPFVVRFPMRGDSAFLRGAAFPGCRVQDRPVIVVVVGVGDGDVPPPVFYRSLHHELVYADHRRKIREITSKMRPPKTTKPRRTRMFSISTNPAHSRTTGGKVENPLTEPDWGDGRLGRVLGTLLELVLGLAASGLLLLGELEVGPPLLRCLGL